MVTESTTSLASKPNKRIVVVYVWPTKKSEVIVTVV